MKIAELYSTQRNLRRKEQIKELVKSIQNNEYIEPVLLSESEDGKVQVENGHHRVIAYYLSGRDVLKEDEYILLNGDTGRIRICKIEKLMALWC